MKNIFSFPNDFVNVGKYKGKTIEWVIKNDKPYFEWMTKVFQINPILIDLSNGLDIVNEEIRYTFVNPTWSLVIRSFKYWKSTRIFGVKKSQQRIISNNAIAEYKCPVPYTKTTKKWIEHVDCTKFHNDSVEYERTDTFYHFDQKDMDRFIESKLSLHQIKQP